MQSSRRGCASLESTLFPFRKEGPFSVIACNQFDERVSLFVMQWSPNGRSSSHDFTTFSKKSRSLLRWRDEEVQRWGGVQRWLRRCCRLRLSLWKRDFISCRAIDLHLWKFFFSFLVMKSIDLLPREEEMRETREEMPSFLFFQCSPDSMKPFLQNLLIDFSVVLSACVLRFFVSILLLTAPFPAFMLWWSFPLSLSLSLSSRAALSTRTGDLNQTNLYQ